ncbi:unnamed protein product [Cuscuta campestris]|uniref:J domain-containing protein n=1 Tax=Cuscuta campestris TaxID=132261 RepID=A0A484NJW2_9ASTE|nr:unnamed protein product [Cuscuta campestris]
MGSNLEEALKARAEAEKRFADKDFEGAKNSALKAQTIFPGLEGISEMVLTFGVHSASVMKTNGEIDLYAILGLDPSAERAKIKKQYKRIAGLIHPDKNKSIGADGAFKLISQAWAVLSDRAKRSSYDHRRNSSSSPRSGLDTFWTVCTSCHVQYEYLRKYVNKRLSCKNCRGVFNAVETGLAPVNGSYQYSSWSYVPKNGYGSHGHGATGDGVSMQHFKHGSEFATNISFQQVTQSTNRKETNGKQNMEKTSNGLTFCSEKQPAKKRGRPPKRMKVELESSYGNNNCEAPPCGNAEEVKQSYKLQAANDPPVKRCLPVPYFDSRKLLIDKARSVIRSKLEEMNLASAAAELDNKKTKELSGIHRSVDLGTAENHPSEPEKGEALAITVPDSDFHDFDKDRAEECFKPKQIWALYDEEDGMPRLYCLVREVIAVKPFKIYVSYLGSRSDSEFGTVNWLCSGFTKSCGHFRAYNSEIVDHVNIFSHRLGRERARRGGCVRIFPRSGDIWALYKNWSSDWDRSTPDKVRHQYEMVEILDDYSEELGVHVGLLIKLDGFKTVYGRSTEKGGVRWIPRTEMLRFSHMVPSCLLKKGVDNLPADGCCWDLDPAATPDELLQGTVEDKRGGQPESPSRHNNIEQGKIGGQPESSALSGLSHESISEVHQVQAQNHLFEPPGFTQKLTEPPGFTQNLTEPSSFTQSLAEPPGFAQNLAEPPGFTHTLTEPLNFMQAVTEPSGFMQTLAEPPGFGKPLSEPPGFEQPLIEPPGFRQPSLDPSGYGQPLIEPPSSGQPLMEAPGFGLPFMKPPAFEQMPPPGFGQTRIEPTTFRQTPVEPARFEQTPIEQLIFGQTAIEPPGFGQTLIKPPSFMQTLMEPPGFRQNLNEPPNFPNVWDIRIENETAKQNELIR